MRVVAAMGIVGALAGLVTAVPGSSAAAADPLQLVLVSQALDIAAGGSIQVVVSVPAEVDLAAPDTSVVVTAYERITTRSSLRRAIDGTLGRAVDAVDLVLADIPRSETGDLVLSVPTETNTRTNAPLQLPREGIYPVVLDVRVGDDNVAELITFVRRLADPTNESETEDQSSEELQVAIALSVKSPARINDRLETVRDDAATEELNRLRAAVEASALPTTVHLPPRLIDLLDPEPRSSLANALQGDEVLAAPSLPIDASIAMQDGQPDLATQWLRNGEDVLRNELGVSASRSVRFVDEPLSKPGAALLRDQGVRMLVMSRRQYAQLPDNVRDLDVPQLTGVRINADARLDVAIPHPALSALLDDPSGGPALTAIYAATELVTLRQELLAISVSPNRSGVILARSDLGIPDPATLGAVTNLIAATQGLRGVSLDEFSVRTDRLLFDGQEIVAGLPETVPGSIAARLDLSAALTEEALQASSMLVPDELTLTNWLAYTSVFATSALGDAEITAISDRLRGEFFAIRSAIGAPAPGAFTLTGRDTELKLRIRNDSARPLTVLVRLDSPKLKLTAQDTFAIPPGGRDVPVPVIALTNGTFGITMRVLTPYGASELAPPIPLTARVNALSDLGKLVTGVLALLVLAWWLRSWRVTVRKRKAAPTVQRHPASAVDGREAATLPPS